MNAIAHTLLALGVAVLALVAVLWACFRKRL